MKPKLKDKTAMNDTRMLFNSGAGNPVQANEAEILTIKKAKRIHHESNFEEFILSEFDIDIETMEEHLQELRLFMIQENVKCDLAHH
jgi:hypothetical protein